jgi:outer membrane lipoprotein-sorting protein
MRALSAAIVCIASIAMAGCAARSGGHFAFPEAAGEPAPEFAQRFEDATRNCREIRTLTAEAGLSGRVGTQRLRGRLQLGVGDPDAMRIEAVAPFGQPMFILAARDGEGTLLLPRDREVLRGASAASIVEALAGIPLSPSELRAVLTGCVAPSASATGGQQYAARGLTAITLADNSIVYVSTTAGAPHIVAARRPGLTIEYSDFQNGLPRRVRLQRTGSSVQATIALELSQLETGVTLGPEAFAVDVPKDARPITLEQLRQAGPLGERASSSSKKTEEN